MESRPAYAHDGVIWTMLRRHDPDQVAATVLSDGGHPRRDVTYGELDHRSGVLAAQMRGHGVRAGDRVALLLGKSVDHLVALLGSVRAGAVVVPLFTAFAPGQLDHRIDGSGAALVVCDERYTAKLAHRDRPAVLAASGDSLGLDTAGVAAPDVHRGGDDELIRLFTSGTSGPAKAVPVPVRALDAFTDYLEYGLHVTADDVYWNAADPGWAYGLYYGTLAPLALGVRLITLTGPFSPAATAQALARLQVTNFAAAPTVYRALRANWATVGCPPHELRLRRLTSAGEPLDADLVDWACNALGAPIHDTYGQTELGMCIGNAWHPDFRRPLRPGSMGSALPGWQVGILTDADRPAPPGVAGRLAVGSGTGTGFWFGGYVDDPTSSAERFTTDGEWYLTGDVATRDEDGYIWFSGRADDIILTAGYRIGPHEIETVLCEHPLVAEAAVVGVADELRGERIEAFVVPTPADVARSDLAEELQELVKERYAAHAYPRAVHFVSALPRTPSGKVQRFLLRSSRSRAEGNSR